MYFSLRELDVKAKSFDVEVAPGEIEFLDPKLRQASPLKAEGKAELVMGSLGEIRVSGHLNVRMETECDRCLEPAACPIDTDFTLFYRPVEDGYGDEKEIDLDEAEMGFYDGDGIDLNEVLREQVILSMPMQKVCSPDCKGMCPVCGQNRNLADCECTLEATDPRWSALKDIQTRH